MSLARFHLPLAALIAAASLVGACGDDETTAGDAAGAAGTSAGSAGAGTAGTAGSGTSGQAGADAGSAGAAGGATADCGSATTHADKVVCAASAFLATLSDSEKASVQYAWTDSVAKTRWSNLPGVTRNGLKFGSMSAASLAAAKAVADAVLTDAGYADFVGVLAADDYLGTLSSGGGMGGPGGGNQYTSGNAVIAFIGVPSTTGDWMLQLGNHHMAYNVTYLAGTGYPTPNHIGAEPKGSFTVNGGTYAPVDDEASAFFGVFKALSTAQLASAYLAGQAFADVLIGPDEYGTGSYPTDSYPAGANRTGVLVSSLSTEQQALVKAAMQQWVDDFDPAIATPLLAAYTTTEALADTYVAWGGTQASGVDPDVSGTYLRIDGPRVWIELSAQGGVVIQGKTHFHTIYRDKAFDYGHSL